MKSKRKKNYNNWEFNISNDIFFVHNIFVHSICFESTTKSGLIRKLNNYLKL